LTIEFVNDMGLPEDHIRANYKSAFDQIRAAGAEPILITPHFVMPEWMGLEHPRGQGDATRRRAAPQNRR
jgi:hypothetical protein